MEGDGGGKSGGGRWRKVVEGEGGGKGWRWKVEEERKRVEADFLSGNYKMEAGVEVEGGVIGMEGGCGILEWKLRGGERGGDRWWRWFSRVETAMWRDGWRWEVEEEDF